MTDTWEARLLGAGCAIVILVVVWVVLKLVVGG